MNKRLVLKLFGTVLLLEAMSLLLPLAVSIYQQQVDMQAFLITIALLLILGIPLACMKADHNDMFAREGILIAALTWISLAFFGALPFYISGAIPSLINAFFEGVSGFTTTGATVLANVEALPKGLQLWRSLMQWLGGMGVLVLLIALFPSINPRMVQLMRAESPGPAPGRIVPKIRVTARMLYIIYVIMTLAMILLLKVSGLSFFDSVLHAFSTAGTGGFSNKNASIGAFNNLPVEIIINVFMILFSVNFIIYNKIKEGNWRGVFANEELRLFFFIIFAATLAIAVNITPMVGTFTQALHQSSFQVVSILSTTGYTTTNFSLWPEFSKFIVILLMIVGSCAGSTSGGLKIIRLLILLKIARFELDRVLHPRSVRSITIEGRELKPNFLSAVMIFFFCYISIIFMTALLISLDGYPFETNFTAAVSMVSNIGPGLGLVGPTGDYAMFSPLSKLVLSAAMIIGRLEIFPILLLFHKPTWINE